MHSSTHEALLLFRFALRLGTRPMKYLSLGTNMLGIHIPPGGF